MNTKKKKTSLLDITSEPSIPMSIPTGEKVPMVDVHAITDRRGININRVGVCDVIYPLQVRKQDGGIETVKATVKLYGSLPKHVKGTNMSRFVEAISEFSDNKPLSGDTFEGLLKLLRKKLESDDVYASAEFDYGVTKVTPATHRKHFSSHKCKFVGQMIKNQYYFTVQTDVLVASYCPCSKEMCLTDKEAGVGKGAHAQRGLISLQARTVPSQPGMWLEDMIRICETSGSAELYPLLKRPDEKFVTIQGYENPKYVEDIARDVIVKIKQQPKVQWARVKVTNFESIHPHNVEAMVEISKKGGRWFQTNRGAI
jgi:GTP cyclohydrolase I